MAGMARASNENDYAKSRFKIVGHLSRRHCPDSMTLRSLAPDQSFDRVSVNAWRVCEDWREQGERLVNRFVVAMALIGISASASWAGGGSFNPGTVVGNTYDELNARGCDRSFGFSPPGCNYGHTTRSDRRRSGRSLHNAGLSAPQQK
jgi:hypothetical protein